MAASCVLCGRAAEIVVTHAGPADCSGVVGHEAGREHSHHACPNGHQWVTYPAVVPA
jgi:hypothetical protein